METIRWKVHPAKERPRDLALAAAIFFLTLGATLIAFNSLFLTTLAAVIIVASIGSFLFPTRYSISEWGVEAKGIIRTRARRWRELRRVEVGPGAALVSPLAKRSWLDRHRGIIVQLDGADRERVVSALRAGVAGDEADEADEEREDG